MAAQRAASGTGLSSFDQISRELPVNVGHSFSNESYDAS
jgi:hypothetical protein